MAKRMKSKIQPAELTFTFGLKGGRNYIDLSQCASLVNRRFYRQGLNWAVSDFKIIASEQPSSGSGAFISVSKLPNTWIMSNAWEKSFRVWQQMIKNATDEAGSQSIKGKFLDFKIFMDNQHHNAGVGANLLPGTDSINWVGTGSALYQSGQWQMSDITIPQQGLGTSVDFELIAVGQNNPGVGASGKDAKSLIQGYADSRALPSPDDPNVPADANTNWYLDIFDDGTSQDAAVTNMLEITGDNPPYPYEGDNAGTTDTMYPGGESNASGLTRHDTAYITNTTVGGVTHLKGGAFPCGLVMINNQADLENVFLQITLVPGTHRGYLAEPMTEM